MQTEAQMEVMVRREMQEAVSDGAAFLDERYPDWYRRIDQGLLDLSDGGYCVVGQLGIEYPLEEELGIYYPARLGFNTTGQASAVFGSQQAYSLLTEMWLDAARERIEAEGDR